MTDTELAQALTGRAPDEVVARWIALAEVRSALGDDALATDFDIEGRSADRKLQVFEILAPHMKAGARTWAQVHDALSLEEHDQVEALLKGT